MIKQIIRVYWRYFRGRLRGRDMRLFGHWTNSRFKCVEYLPSAKLTKQEFTDHVLRQIGPECFAQCVVVPCNCEGKNGSFRWKGKEIGCPGWRTEYAGANPHAPESGTLPPVQATINSDQESPLYTIDWGKPVGDIEELRGR